MVYRDVDALRRLKRTELQQIATQENIKANQKSDAIIKQLLEKYPQGVPRKATPAVSFGSRPHKATKGTAGQGSVAPNRTRTGSTTHANNVTEHEVQQESSTSQQKARGSANPTRTANESQVANTAVARPPKRTRVSDHAAVIATPPRPQKKQRLGPSLKDVRYVLREMKEHTNELPKLQTSLCEMAALLEEAQEQTKTINDEIEDLIWLRWCVEEDVMKEIKTDVSLIDGTAVLGSDSEKGAEWRKWKANQSQLT
ncbi:hypothetical protein AAF712_000243 [Marasmius tenuissimus]|uniref:Uncharacterized protein n=1 Tax=Marasmius tenuissimus TaxID=585030 RepID=A0ABR3AEX8_9AGAR